MADRGDIVDYTVAILVDVLDTSDGIWKPALGFVTRPAIVLEDHGASGLTLHVFGDAVAGELRVPVAGVQPGPAVTDKKQGKRADPTAVLGQPGTWSTK